MKKIIFLTILYFIFIFKVLPIAEKEIGGKPLDLKIFKTYDETLEILEGYGDEGRKKYEIIELTIDIIYSGLYSTLLFFILSSFNAKRYNKIPFCILIFDYIENFYILLMLNQYPNISIFTFVTVNILTFLKFFVLGITLIMIWYHVFIRVKGWKHA